MTDDFDPYAEMVKERAPELFCEVCGHYPIEPVHGHFACPACHNITKCCEGMPLDLGPMCEVRPRTNGKRDEGSICKR